MAKVKTLTRNTRTSTASIAKRAAELVEEYLPDVIRRVVDVDKASALNIKVSVRPAGRTEATKDPEVYITAKPEYGEEVVRLKARLTGEGDDAQLSLIAELMQGEVGFEDDNTGETGEDLEAATG